MSAKRTIRPPSTLTKSRAAAASPTGSPLRSSCRCGDGCRSRKGFGLDPQARLRLVPVLHPRHVIDEVAVTAGGSGQQQKAKASRTVGTSRDRASREYRSGLSVRHLGQRHAAELRHRSVGHLARFITAAARSGLHDAKETIPEGQQNVLVSYLSPCEQRHGCERATIQASSAPIRSPGRGRYERRARRRRQSR